MRFHQNATLQSEIDADPEEGLLMDEIFQIQTPGIVLGTSRQLHIPRP